VLASRLNQIEQKLNSLFGLLSSQQMQANTEQKPPVIVALRAHANGQFVWADQRLGGYLAARSEHVKDWVRFYFNKM
jgi:hypothetical protein